MKKYLWLLLLLLCPFLFAGSIQQKHIAVIGRMNVAAGGGATDYTADGNCQGAWLFADDLTDESGEGNTLTANGFGNGANYTVTRPTKAAGYATTGKSIEFDGNDDDLTRACNDVSANFPGKAQKTDAAVCYWMNSDAVDAIKHILDTGKFTFRNNWNEWDNSIFDSDDDSASPNNGTIVKDTWYHVCFDLDGSANQGTYWISTEAAFGDTSNGATVDYGAVDNVRGECLTNLAIAVDSDGADSEFDGHIYQLIVFDADLVTVGANNGGKTAAQVAAEIYNSGIKGG